MSLEFLFGEEPDTKEKKKEKSNVDDKFILSNREHVRLRPNTYIGSVNMEKHERFINGEYREVSYVQGLVKIVEEIIDNSVDEAIRTNFEYANKITVDIDSNQVTVSDNGRGIPQMNVSNPETGEILPKPVAAWTIVKAGSNFSDEDRVTMGMNGMGASLTNFFSTVFIGETSDGKTKMTVNCTDGANNIAYRTSPCKTKGTTVKFVPDFSLFGVTCIDAETMAVLEDRLMCLAIAFPNITFTFNGTKLSNNFKLFASKFGENNIVSTNNAISYIIAPGSDGFKFKSFVNGLDTKNGGTHVDAITDGLCEKLIPRIKRAHGVEISKARIKEFLSLIVFVHNFNAPSFDSQTKVKLTNTPGEFNKHANINYDKLAKQIMDAPEIITPIIETALARKAAEDKANLKKIQKKAKDSNIAKHCPANGLGDPNVETILFLTEGDSAVGQIIECRDKLTQGAFPLRGKIKNVWGEFKKSISTNKELIELMAILNLKPNDSSEMTYTNVGILVDADVDGKGSILPLLLAFFSHWPELFEQNRIRFIRTPIVIATKNGKEVWYYEHSEYKKDAELLKNVRYIKGLGSLRLKDYDAVLNSKLKYEIIKLEDNYKEIFDVIYGDESDERKLWLDGEHKICSFEPVDYGDCRRSLVSVINNEALEYSTYVVTDRAIPHFIDGFKPSQRFFLYSALKQSSGMNKVATIAGRVSEYGYHHAESAASDAGQLMVADWANNIPLFEKDGFFGSRLVKKPSAPRYTFCALSEMFNRIYKDHDLAPENPDPEIKTPLHYLPIIPMVLVNGADGIAVGYATSIPMYDPISVTESVRNVLNGKKPTLKYKYPKFNGVYTDDAMIGVYELVGKTKLILKEIPYKFNREQYITLLKKLVDKKRIVSYVDDSDKNGFCYNITLKRDYSDNLTSEELHEKIITDFSLREKFNPNLNVYYNELLHFDNSEDLLIKFVDIRKSFYQIKIDKMIAGIKEKIKFGNAKIEFITNINNGTIVLSGMTKQQAIDEICKHENLAVYSDKLVSLNIYMLTTDERDNLAKQVADLHAELSVWESTTPEEQYLADIDNLHKYLKSKKF
ncbi:DNA topoisomerase II large subunit [Morganella phage vB_Mm5]